MGLFSHKKKEPVYDAADCSAKKLRLREIFNETVENGNSYEVLYGYMSSSEFRPGLVYDTNTTTFSFFVIGYRVSDFDLVLVQVDSTLEHHTNACPIEMDKIVNVSYDAKIKQVCFQYEKNYGSYGELLKIVDTDEKTLYGPKNIQQQQEREKFLDFAEAFREQLAAKGYTLSKWKRA